jgi:hypothetical protein
MARLKDLKEQHPALNITVLDILKEIDPSETNKYMHFLIKNLYSIYNKEDMKDALVDAIVGMYGKGEYTVLEKFEQYSKDGAIHADVSTMKSFDDMRVHVTYADEIARLKEMEKQVVKWYMDDEWLVITPVTFEASKTYGKGTRWCTTNEVSWHTYKSGVLIYIINRKKQKNCKWAANFKGDTIEYYDEQDSRMSDSLMLPINDEVRKVLLHIYQNFRGYSCERVYKHHSSDYVFRLNKYWEIEKMRQSSIREALGSFGENPSQLDKERIQKLTERLKTPGLEIEERMEEEFGVKKKSGQYQYANDDGVNYEASDNVAWMQSPDGYRFRLTNGYMNVSEISSAITMNVLYSDD